MNIATILLMSNGGGTARVHPGRFLSPHWRVIRAGDEIEMLSAVKAHGVDLVVLHLPMDCTLDMDVPNVIHQISSGDYVPVMVLTDEAVDSQCCEYLDSGVDDVVREDISPAKLSARIRALLRVRELYQQLEPSRAALRQALDRERKLLAKLRKDNEHLQKLCTTDPLTHVQNVRSFQGILAHEFASAKRYNHPVSVLAFDLDHFKVINDTHGHPSGDYVLKEMAVILTQSVRAADIIARTGGEEFSVILPRADRRKAARMAERIRAKIYKRKFIVHGEDIHVTTSVGSATFPFDAHITEPQMLMYFSDQALLQAKEAGRDRVLAFGDLPAAVRRRLWRQFSSEPTEPVEESDRRIVCESLQRTAGAAGDGAAEIFADGH